MGAAESICIVSQNIQRNTDKDKKEQSRNLIRGIFLLADMVMLYRDNRSVQRNFNKNEWK